MYAVMTWGDKMPASFPLETSQNSGNMVHSRAPFSMFPNSVGMDYGFEKEGYNSFADFVNDRCDAVIIPFANTLRLDPKHDQRGFSVAKSIDQFKVPVVPFGLGAQAPLADMDAVELGPGMVELVKKLSASCPAVSVRGDFTYEIFKKYGSAENVYNTGCPSFFSRPEAFRAIRSRIDSGAPVSRAAFSGSLHHEKDPKEQLNQAIDQDLHLIEPVNAHLHRYYVDSLTAGAKAKAPYFLSQLLQRSDWSTARLSDYMARRYHLFRDLESWIAFNKECLDGVIGTRFHVSMAGLLSGILAVWVVHDSRTVELCERLSLPHVSVQESLRKPYREIIAEADFSPMFKELEVNFDDFNKFLSAASLPEVEHPAL